MVTRGKTKPASTVGKLCWHVHHDILVEVLTEPIENRIAYIKRQKPESEQATRLRLIHVVRGPLPAALAKTRNAFAKAWDARDKAWAALDKARDAFAKAWDACDKAWDAYAKTRDALAKTLADSIPALLKLHAKECPNCPWNGRSIFPGAK